jgi:hypothetical protein
MRKIFNATYVTLDAVVEGPHLRPSRGRRGEHLDPAALPDHGPLA